MTILSVIIRRTIQLLVLAGIARCGSGILLANQTGQYDRYLTVVSPATSPLAESYIGNCRDHRFIFNNVFRLIACYSTKSSREGD